jgi:hypothetical protein
MGGFSETRQFISPPDKYGATGITWGRRPRPSAERSSAQVFASEKSRAAFDRTAGSGPHGPSTAFKMNPCGADSRPWSFSPPGSCT